MCLSRERAYEATPAAVGAARDFVSAFAVAMLHPRGWAVADDAALVVSELMSSAIESGCREVEVSADLHVERFDLVVTGHAASDAPPPEGRLQGLRAAVVQELSARAELRRTPTGTLVGT